MAKRKASSQEGRASEEARLESMGTLRSERGRRPSNPRNNPRNKQKQSATTTGNELLIDSSYPRFAVHRDPQSAAHAVIDRMMAAGGLDDDVQPWHQLPTEPNLWYERFLTYLLLGNTRSLRLTYLYFFPDKAQKNKGDGPRSYAIPPIWADVRDKWLWESRASAWDRHRMAWQYKEKLRLLEEQDKQRMEISDKLVEKAKAMLDAPLFKEEREGENGETVVYYPTKWSLRDAATLFELADKLKTEALGGSNRPEELQILEQLVQVGMAPESLLETVSTAIAQMQENVRLALSGAVTRSLQALATAEATEGPTEVEVTDYETNPGSGELDPEELDPEELDPEELDPEE